MYGNRHSSRKIGMGRCGRHGFRHATIEMSVQHDGCCGLKEHGRGRAFRQDNCFSTNEMGQESFKTHLLERKAFLEERLENLNQRLTELS